MVFADDEDNEHKPAAVLLNAFLFVVHDNRARAKWSRHSVEQMKNACAVVIVTVPAGSWECEKALFNGKVNARANWSKHARRRIRRLWVRIFGASIVCTMWCPHFSFCRPSFGLTSDTPLTPLSLFTQTHRGHFYIQNHLNFFSSCPLTITLLSSKRPWSDQSGQRLSSNLLFNRCLHPFVFNFFNTVNLCAASSASGLLSALFWLFKKSSLVYPSFVLFSSRSGRHRRHDRSLVFRLFFVVNNILTPSIHHLNQNSLFSLTVYLSLLLETFFWIHRNFSCHAFSVDRSISRSVGLFHQHATGLFGRDLFGCRRLLRHFFVNIVVYCSPVLRLSSFVAVLPHDHSKNSLFIKLFWHVQVPKRDFWFVFWSSLFLSSSAGRHQVRLFTFAHKLPHVFKAKMSDQNIDSQSFRSVSPSNFYSNRTTPKKKSTTPYTRPSPYPSMRDSSVFRLKRNFNRHFSSTDNRSQLKSQQLNRSQFCNPSAYNGLFRVEQDIFKENHLCMYWLINWFFQYFQQNWTHGRRGNL